MQTFSFYALNKLTLLDYPGIVACTVFTSGCNLRCPFCHNPNLVDIKTDTSEAGGVSISELFEFLKKRQGIIEGVCITGGEALIRPEVIEIGRDIRKMGFKLKIDTNGTLPERLKLVEADYIAMDIKTSLEKYHLVGNVQIEKIKESIDYIINSYTSKNNTDNTNIDYEFRTTAVPELVTIEDIKKITELIKGCKKYFLAKFRNSAKLLNPAYEKIEPYESNIMQQMKDIVLSANIPCELRDNY